mgnify:CR=1 FL=1
MGFWKSLFTGSEEKQEDNQRKEEKNFDILKFDGVRAQRMGRLDYALRCFDEALNLKEDFETLSFKSSALISLNRLDEAQEVLERMTELEPQLVDVRIALTNILYMTEQYDAMKTAAMKAVECDAQNPLAYFLQGRAEDSLGQLDSATESLTKAIELRPDFIEARNLRAEVSLKASQTAQAMDDIKEVLALNSEEETALYLRAHIYHTVTGDMEKAKADYRHLIEIDPFHKEAYTGLLAILKAEGNEEEAKKLEEEAAALNIDNEDMPNYAIGGMEKRDVLGL